MENTGIFDLINKITLNDLPRTLIRDVKQQILDDIGFSIAGAQKQSGQERIAAAKASSVLQEASIIGDGAKTSARDAFLTNTYLNHQGKYNEGGYYIPYHPGSVVTKAAVCAGEKLNACIGDVVIATLLAHEMIMQARRTTREIIWPECRSYPDATLIPYFCLPDIAHFVLELVSSQLPDDRTTITALLMETLSLLQAGVDRDTFDSSVQERLMNCYLDSFNHLEYTKNTWRQCITQKIGMSPTLLDHFILGNALALERALRPILLLPEHIKDIMLLIPIGLLHLLDEKGDEAKLRIATAAAFYVFGARSNQSWHLTTTLDRTVISLLAEKIKFDGDTEPFLEPRDTPGLLFTAKVHIGDSRVQTGRILCPWMAFRGIIQTNARERFEGNTIFFISEKQCAELYEKLIGSDSTPITELLELTCPPALTSDMLRKLELLEGWQSDT